jgi:hypothetical protein
MPDVEVTNPSHDVVGVVGVDNLFRHSYSTFDEVACAEPFDERVDRHHIGRVMRDEALSTDRDHWLEWYARRQRRRLRRRRACRQRRAAPGGRLMARRAPAGKSNEIDALALHGPSSKTASRTPGRASGRAGDRDPAAVRSPQGPRRRAHADPKPPALASAGALRQARTLTQARRTATTAAA